MISLIKMSLKLLFRNKGFIFFLLVTPAVSTFILNIKTEHTVYHSNEDKNIIYELKDYSEKAVYAGDTKACIIKVYDGNKSELSEYVLRQLEEKGMFSICRCDVSSLTEKEVEELAKKDAFNDRAAMLLYLKEGFDKAIFEGDFVQGLELYDVSDDERKSLFKEELSSVLERIKNVQTITSADEALVLQMLDSIENEMPDKKIVNFAGKDEIVLNSEQTNQVTQIGYAFAIITLGFLFCGVCVAHSVIEEQNNKVFTRIMLTKLTGKEYFISKFIIALIISVLQTLVLFVCLSLVKGIDFGIEIGYFLLIIFLLGLIFSTLSLLVGVILGDVMSSNYAIFSIWSISALLAGLYFPLDNTTKLLKTLSYLMPQKWFMDAAKLLLIDDNSAFSMLICITVAYLIVIISVGGVGLKIKRYE